MLDIKKYVHDEKYDLKIWKNERIYTVVLAWQDGFSDYFINPGIFTNIIKFTNWEIKSKDKQINPIMM